MADESTTSNDDPTVRAPKVKRPAYLSLDARVKEENEGDEGGGGANRDGEGMIGKGGEFPDHGDKFWGKAPIGMSSAWHDAARDWHICSAITFLLFLMLISLVSIMDVLRNVMLIAFFVIFLGFLVAISGYFHIRAGTLYGYHAAYLPYKRNGIEFAEAFMEMASEKMQAEGEEIECVSGHTFGLLSVVKCLKFPDGEIVEINTFHVTGGMVTGLYLLVKAPWESAVWEILGPLTKR